MALGENWRRLEGWLRERLPEVHEDIKEGCSEEDLTEFEALVGGEFPQDFEDFYRVHDGQRGAVPTGLFYGLTFLPLRHAMIHWRSMAKILEDEDLREMADRCESARPGAVKEVYFSRSRVPFAHDFGGNFLGVDLDPGPAGRVGQVINFGRDEREMFVVADSFGGFVEWLIGELESGNYDIRAENDGGRGFNTKTPASGHFLDSVGEIFSDRREV